LTLRPIDEGDLSPEIVEKIADDTPNQEAVIGERTELQPRRLVHVALSAAPFRKNRTRAPIAIEHAPSR